MRHMNLIKRKAMTSAVQNKLTRLVCDNECSSSVAVNTMFDKRTAAYLIFPLKVGLTT